MTDKYIPVEDDENGHGHTDEFHYVCEYCLEIQNQRILRILIDMGIEDWKKYEELKQKINNLTIRNKSKEVRS